MMRHALPILLASFSCMGAELSSADAEARLRMAHQIARERNDRDLVARAEKMGRDWKAAVPLDADLKLRDFEKAVGIDPGGWSMAGQPLFHPTPAIESALKASGPKLKAAMEAADPKAIRDATAEVILLLGDQAGVPDGRRPGIKPPPLTLSASEATILFLNALGTQGRVVRQLTDGEPLSDQMLRIYAYLLDAITTLHLHVRKHAPERLSDLDRLTQGLAGILVKLQQPEGHFPFPDLRGKNIRFGDMITKQLAAGAVEVKDGWLITADPDGGSQFDTGLCGAALLRAGELHQEQKWKDAGLRAADWAAAQKCCSNFNYNAFSVSLLSIASRISGESKYREAALAKFRLGVAPGQAPNGRWLDPHNARTVYHVIILRALGDLGSSSEVDAVALPAIRALLDEFDAMGITVEALPELVTLYRTYPADMRLKKEVQSMAASIVGKCTDGKRTKMGAQPHQLAAVVEALVD